MHLANCHEIPVVEKWVATIVQFWAYIKLRRWFYSWHQRSSAFVFIIYPYEWISIWITVNGPVSRKRVCNPFEFLQDYHRILKMIIDLVFTTWIHYFGNLWRLARCPTPCLSHVKVLKIGLWFKVGPATV